MEQQVLTESETAEYIRMSRSFLRKARMHGELENHTPGPPWIRIGRSVRYIKDDLDEWLEEQRTE